MTNKQNSPLVTLGKPFQGLLILSIICALLGVASGMIPYFAVAYLIIKIFESTLTMQDILLSVGTMLIGYVGRMILVTCSTLLSHRVAFRIIENVRKKMIYKMQRMPLGNVLATPSGSLKTLLVDTTEKIEMCFAHIIPELTANLTVPIFMATYLFWLDWRMAILALITLPLGLLCYMGMTKNYQYFHEKVQNASKHMNASMVAYVHGIEIIKTFNQSKESYASFTSAIAQNRDALKSWFLATNTYYVVGMAIAPSSLLFALPAGLYWYMEGSIEATTLIMCLVLSIGIVDPILHALGYTDKLALAQAVLKETQSFLDQEEMPQEEKNVELAHKTLEVKNISFAYEKDGKKAINNLSFRIEPQKMLAIVGASGSGKSTLAKLLVRFWDVEEGQITLGNVDIRHMPTQQLLRNVAYVAQDTFLFNKSLKDNICLAKPHASEEELRAVIRAAACDFIYTLPKGWDSMAGEGGVKLSGGERQRITLARAMLKKSPLIILDEATAFADAENQLLIQQALHNLVRKSTLVVIAHRLETIVQANTIMVMEEGHSVAQGSHEELLLSSPVYQELWQAHQSLSNSIKAEEQVDVTEQAEKYVVVDTQKLVKRQKLTETEELAKAEELVRKKEPTHV